MYFLHEKTLLFRCVACLGRSYRDALSSLNTSLLANFRSSNGCVAGQPEAPQKSRLSCKKRCFGTVRRHALRSEVAVFDGQGDTFATFWPPRARSVAHLKNATFVDRHGVSSTWHGSRRMGSSYFLSTGTCFSPLLRAAEAAKRGAKKRSNQRVFQLKVSFQDVAGEGIIWRK